MPRNLGFAHWLDETPERRASFASPRSPLRPCPPRAITCAICWFTAAFAVTGNAVDLTITSGQSPARCRASATCRPSPPPCGTFFRHRHQQPQSPCGCISRRTINHHHPILCLRAKILPHQQLRIALLYRPRQQRRRFRLLLRQVGGEARSKIIPSLLQHRRGRRHFNHFADHQRPGRRPARFAPAPDAAHAS